MLEKLDEKFVNQIVSEFTLNPVQLFVNYEIWIQCNRHLLFKKIHNFKNLHDTGFGSEENIDLFKLARLFLLKGEQKTIELIKNGISERIKAFENFLDQIAPEGTYFGSKKDEDGSPFGFWKL